MSTASPAELSEAADIHFAADLPTKKPSSNVALISFADCAGFGMLAGSLVGIVDATTVVFNILGARTGVQYVPWTIWPVSVAVWIVVLGAIASAMGAVARLRTFVVPVVVLAGPAVLFVLRVMQFRRQLPSFPAIEILLFLLVLAGVYGTVRLSRLWKIRPRLRMRIRHIGLIPVALVVVAVLTLFAARSAHAATLTPAPSGGKNVVLIFLDTVRYDRSGAGDGGEQWGPNLHAFAQNALRFKWAMAPAPWTLPSHVSVMAGIPEYVLALTPINQTITPYAFTLPKRFARRGYETAAFIANPILHDHTGFDAGFNRYEYSERSLDFCRTSLGVIVGKFSLTRGVCAWTSFDVSQRAIHYIEHATKPYFLTLNYFDAHDPYWLPPAQEATVPRRLSMADHSTLLRVITRGVPLNPSDRTRIMAIYDQAIHGMDASMKPLLERLDRDVAEGRTVVAIVADHGEQFGEHNLCGHGNSVYAPVLRVPMVIKARGLTSMEVQQAASPTQLYNVLQYLATANSIDQPRILSYFAAAPAVSHIWFGDDFRGTSALWSVAADGFHLVDKDGGYELFDLAADPDETRNLIRAGVRPPARLVDALLHAKQGAKARSMQPYDNLRGIGYLP